MALIVQRPSYRDKESIIELCSQIWGGYDYIPYLLDRWLSISDPFLIIRDTQNNKVCAVDHATIFNDVAYGEGLRVHVDYRGKGLAKQITMEIMKEVFERGIRDYKALIFSQTLDSIHLSEKAFFEKVNGYYLLEKKVQALHQKDQPLEDIRVRPIFPEEITRNKSEFNDLLFATNQEIVDVWTYYPSTDYLTEKFLFECTQGKLIAGLHEHEKEIFSICLLTKPGDWIKKMIPVLESYASHFGCEVISVAIPFSLNQWVSDLMTMGFTTLWDPGALTLEESSACLYSLNRAKMDQIIIPKQLDKPTLPSNYYRCLKRCHYGFSQVIESFPLKDGEPFPTTYYLTCPHLRYHISKLEESGVISVLDHLKHTEAYKQLDDYYTKERKSRLSHSLLDSQQVLEKYEDALTLGIGGIKDQRGIKCLHLHAATYLAKLEDPVGHRVMDLLKEAGVMMDCDDMSCFEHFKEYYMG